MKRSLTAWLAALALCACDERPVFTKAEIDAADPVEGLPAGFLMGTATAAHQVEGGNVNDWSRWEETRYEDGTPHIRDQSVSGLADDSWNRFDQDLAAMRELGANAYRFSIEWSRVQPSPDVWREDVVERYRQMLVKLRAAGVTPMVTLWHFTLPRWAADAGGWESDATVDAFEAYAGRLAQALGGEVDLWCTVNEPNVYAVESYMEGIWPPGKHDSAAAAEVLYRLMAGHARAAAQLRAHDLVDADGDGFATRIGIAHHVRVFQAASASVADQAVAALTDAFFNEALVEGARTGRLKLVVPLEVDLDREVPGLAGSFDYLGLNYYTRDHLRTDLGSASFQRQYVPDRRPKNDLGWDLYPEGLYLFLVRFGRYGWPIFITENGIADASGETRPDYLRAHLYAVSAAARKGVEVRGYFHWSLIDNFEWAEGYTAKFGLFRVDFADPLLPRVPTAAVPLFRDSAQRLSVR